MFETLWSAFAQTGVVEKPCWTYAETYFGGLDEEEQSRLRMLVSDTPKLAASIKSESVDALDRIGVAPSPINLGLASKLVMGARAAAAEACRRGSPRVELTNTCLSEADAGGRPVFGSSATSVAVMPARNPVVISKDHSAELEVPEPWCLLTPTQVAERFIADTPKMFEHRQSGKRASEQTGEQTLRQIRWAALLLEKSVPTGAPFWRVTFEDVKRFDRWLDRLPVTCGNSPGDRAGSTTLEAIAAKAEERLEGGEIAADEIGLMTPTANNHYRKLAQVHAFLRSRVPALAPLNFGPFTQPDRKDERTARARYTLAQGVAIFSLAPWTGCAGVDDRLSAGALVWHTSLFYLLILVWYTGARREELCELMIIDVDCVDGIWFLRIETTETGRVKNTSAVRCISLADEVVRLGFVFYVQALKAEGETLVFPDLEPADGTKHKRGDVFSKLWWIYIRPLVPGLLRRQAMHAARHTVSDGLKQQEIFLEFRNDLLGHRSKGGEGGHALSFSCGAFQSLGYCQPDPACDASSSNDCSIANKLAAPQLKLDVALTKFGRVRQRGVISGVAPGRIDQAALRVICSGGTSSICGVARAAMPSICM